MNRIALRTRILTGQEAAYEAVHRRIPALLAADLIDAGVRDWRIWRDGPDLFHSLEVVDRARMRTMMRASTANAEWQSRVSSLLEPTAERGDLPLVWSLREQLEGVW